MDRWISDIQASMDTLNSELSLPQQEIATSENDLDQSLDISYDIESGALKLY